MQKIKRHGPIALGLLFFICPFLAHAENIDAYTSHIEINTNGSIAVQEEIIYNFGDQLRHGIYRHVPIIYRAPTDLQDTKIELSSIMVTDGRGNLIPTQYDGGGNYVELKIGDPNVTVTGPNFYVIRYTVWGAIKFSPQGDELNWNVTENTWAYPVSRARTEFVFPTPIAQSALEPVCTIGFGTQVRNCAVATTTFDGKTGGVSVLRFTLGDLRPHEQVWVQIKIPKGVLSKTTPEKKLSVTAQAKLNRTESVLEYLLFGLLLLVLYPFVRRFLRERRFKGEDNPATTKIPSIDNVLSLIASSFLYDRGVTSGGICAEIISLALRGYIVIERVVVIENENNIPQYNIIKKRVSTKSLPQEELLFLKNIPLHIRTAHTPSQEAFTVLQQLLQEHLTLELTERGYLATSVKLKSKFIHHIIAGIALVFIARIITDYNWLLILLGLCISFYGWFGPKETAKGREGRATLITVKKYLKREMERRVASTQRDDATLLKTSLPFAPMFVPLSLWMTQFQAKTVEECTTAWYRNKTQENTSKIEELSHFIETVAFLVG